MGEIRFLGRARGGRCVYCHDSLAGQVQTCPECSATWHEDCGQGAPRCPTTGCSGPAPGTASKPRGRRITRRAAEPASNRGRSEELARADRPRPRTTARIGPYVRLASSALWNTVAACGATAYLLWPVLSWPTFWKMCSTGKRGSHTPAPLAALFMIATLAVAVWALYITVRWLMKIPGVLREVSSLLDDTRPTAMRLTVYSEGSGKHIKWFAKLAGGRKPLTIALDGILPPGWLCKKGAYEHHPVLVYGLPPPGPYIIEFADGALALVHPE